MGEMINAYHILVGKPEGKKHSKDLSVDGKIILEWIFEKWGGEVGSGCIWLRIGTNSGPL